MLKTKVALDRRDIRLLHKVWLALTEHFEAQRHGHNHKFQALEKALENAEDEMGPPEDYEVM